LQGNEFLQSDSLHILHRGTAEIRNKINNLGFVQDGLLKTNRFRSGEDLEQTLLRYVALYNHQFPQSALKIKTPIQAIKDWYASHPHLFKMRPHDRPGRDM
jgi:hypothetical protein